METTENKEREVFVNDDFYYDEESGSLQIINTTTRLLFEVRRIIRQDKLLKEVIINGGGGQIIPAFDLVRILSTRVLKNQIRLRVIDPCSAGGMYACMKGAEVEGTWAAHGLTGESPALSQYSTSAYAEQIGLLPNMEHKYLKTFLRMLDLVCKNSVQLSIDASECWVYAFKDDSNDDPWRIKDQLRCESWLCSTRSYE